MTRRLLTLLIVGSFAALVAEVVAICRDFVRMLDSDPAGWRE